MTPAERSRHVVQQPKPGPPHPWRNWRAIGRAARWIVGGIAVAVLGLLAYSYWDITYGPRSRLPAPIRALKDPRAFAQAEALYNELLSRDAARREKMDSVRKLEVGTPQGLAAAADQWVNVVNELATGTILRHKVQPTGDLHVLLGIWYTTLDPDNMLLALDTWGTVWRLYLHSLVGPWDSRQGYDPGILVIDTLGVQAENRNGKNTIYRLPAY